MNVEKLFRTNADLLRSGKQSENLRRAAYGHIAVATFFLVMWVDPLLRHWMTGVASLVIGLAWFVALRMAGTEGSTRRLWLYLLLLDVLLVSAASYPNLQYSSNLRGSAVVHEVVLLLFLLISLFSLDGRIVSSVTAAIVLLQLAMMNTVGTPPITQVLHVGIICIFGYFGTRFVLQASSLAADVEKLSHLKRFFSPGVANLVLRGDLDMLQGHRNEITVVFLDLRGFTAFTERTQPERVMTMLRDYHRVAGELVDKYQGTVEHFAGDGLMIIFGDPVPTSDATQRAVRMSVEIQRSFSLARKGWPDDTSGLALGVGIAKGVATLGAIGFEGRMDYGAVGSVCNLSARLCAQAGGGEILIDDSVLTAAEEVAKVTAAGNVALKGFAHPLAVFRVHTEPPVDQPAGWPSALPDADLVVESERGGAGLA